MHLDLHSLNVEDHVDEDTPTEFKSIIASTNKNTQTSHLFQLKLNRTQRIVSYNETLIEVFDQDIDLTMTELKFVLTPKSILTIINYTLTTFTNPDAPELPTDVLKHNSPDLEEAPQKINMRMNMDDIIVVLNDDSTKLATFQLSAAQVELFILPEKMKLNAKLGGMQLTNEVHDGLPTDSPLRS